MNNDYEDRDRAEYLALRVVSLRRAGEALLEEARLLSEKYASLVESGAGERPLQPERALRQNWR